MDVVEDGCLIGLGLVVAYGKGCVEGVGFAIFKFNFGLDAVVTIGQVGGVEGAGFAATALEVVGCSSFLFKFVCITIEVEANAADVFTCGACFWG